MLEKLPDAFGRALRERRAGLDQLLVNRLQLGGGQGLILVTSPAFADQAPMPSRHTADGDGLSPPLAWTQIPPTAESLLIVVEDADAPTPHPLVHAIAVDLPPHLSALPEGALNAAGADAGAHLHLHLGRNSYLRADWLPPDPPPGHGPHRYAFQVFALNAPSGLSGAPGRDAVAKLLGDYALASGCLIGTYERG